MSKGIKLIDARMKFDYAKGYIPGSINIQGNNSFATWAGWFLNYEEPFILLANESQLEDLTRKLMRVGLDRIMGYIPSVKDYVAAGGKLDLVDIIDTNTFKEMMKGEDIQIVDLRGASEYKAGYIKNADHVFVGTVLQNIHKISKEKKVVIHCQGGDRASIGYSLLAREGYKNVLTYSGSINEWVALGNPLEHV
jgi:hydroxyacylglutathione hydrolase